jgi:hypothetical protein
MIKRGMVGLVAVALAAMGVAPGIGPVRAGAAPPSAARAAKPASSAAASVAASQAAATAAVSSQTFRVGPLDLAPAGQPGDEVNRIFADMPRPEGDLAIRGITWRMVDMDGNTVEPHMVHLHHIVLLDTGRRDQLCSFPSASRFAGTGKELSPLHFPDPYAYHSKAGAPWQGVYDVMNMGDMPMSVSIEYTVEWSEPGPFLDVEPYFFDVTGCWGDSTFDVPGGGGPDSVYEKPNEYTMTRQGLFVAAGAHLHDGAIDVALAGPHGEVCRSAAMYEGDPPMLMGIEPCGPLDDHFEVGDRYTITARYHNEAPVLDAMGIMISYLHHTDPPPPEPTVDIELTSVDGSGLHALLTCRNAANVSVDASVRQDKGRLPIYGSGVIEPACTPEPTPVTVPLLGSGSLTGGTVHVEMSAFAWTGDRYASDFVSEDLRATGRLDLTEYSSADGGPHPITIDARVRRGPDGPELTGTVQCDAPTQLFVDASGWQRAGRYTVHFDGSAGSLLCDGTTAFTIPVSAYQGRLVGGPAHVTVYAFEFGEDDGVASIASRDVRLPGTSPADAAMPPPPDSPLHVMAVRRSAGGVAVTLTVDECPAGADLFAQVYLQEVTGKGVRIPAAPEWSAEDLSCAGGPVTLDVWSPLDPRGNRVRVEAYVYISNGTGYSYASTWGEFPIVR